MSQIRVHVPKGGITPAREEAEKGQQGIPCTSMYIMINSQTDRGWTHMDRWATSGAIVRYFSYGKKYKIDYRIEPPYMTEY